MYAIDESQGDHSPSFFDSAISVIKNSGTAVVNGVEYGASTAFHAGESVIDTVTDKFAEVEKKIAAPLTGPLMYAALGLVAVGGIYLLLTYRQAHGKAF